MQGDKLLPGQQNIGGCGVRPGAPDRGRRNGARDAFEDISETSLGKLGRKLGALGIAVATNIRGETMGKNVDQRAFEFLRIGVAELGLGQLLEMVVQQPRVVERRLQDQRFAARDRSAPSHRKCSAPVTYRARDCRDGFRPFRF